MMHPLGEKASVQRNLPVVRGSHLLEALEQHGAQDPRRRHRVGGHVRDKRSDLFGIRHGSLKIGLELAHQVLAFVPAANRIQARRFQAVRARHHVVGDDDLRLLLIGVIQGTQGSQVVGLLGEAPVAVQRLLVEGRETHTTCFLAFHVAKSRLQRTTFAVVEMEIRLADALHQPQRGVVGWDWRAFVVLLLQLHEPVISIRPIGVLPCKNGLLGMDLLGGVRREVACKQETHIPGTHEVRSIFAREILVHRKVVDLVCGLQPVRRLMAHQFLQRHGELDEAVEIETLVVELLLEQVLHVGRHPLLDLAKLRLVVR
mmetsp:Transcript_126605/g.300758  ORF Transcript_126605/g.300758 Transcript_126605/m.300758 type:complete len:315 (-) Transcript_126605:417-1361(-)